MTQILTPPTLFRASAPSATLLAELGPLAELPGTWVGKGFNLIELPDFHDNKPFQVKLNATQETLTFTAIGAPIPDRGSVQDDIFFVGLHYFQQVSDAIANTALHTETGMWLHVPETTDPAKKASIVRLSTIPHGDSLLAQGHAGSNTGFFAFGPANAIPFTLDPSSGQPQFLSSPYTDPITQAPLPPGIPTGANLNPNLVLNEVLTNEQNAGFTMGKTETLLVNARPVGGINNTPIKPKPEDVGGIVNIPFIQKNANVQNFGASFTIELMHDPGGNKFVQLQYTQTVLLLFETVNGELIHWPHVSVGTLIKQ